MGVVAAADPPEGRERYEADDLREDEGHHETAIGEAGRRSAWLGVAVRTWSFLLHRIVGPLIEALLPADCPSCEKPLPGISRGGLCTGCWESIEPILPPLCPRCGIHFPAFAEEGRPANHPCGRCLSHPPSFDGARCALAYEGAVRTLLHLFKFDRRRDLARPLARAVVAALPSEERFDIVIPVPLHWSRRLARGYNQAALLGRAIARGTGAPYTGRLLVKRRRTRDQSGLNAAARRKNLAGAFGLTSSRLAGRLLRRRDRGHAVQTDAGARDRTDRLAGLRVLLVDDILTTGATAEECARVLKRAGAARVFVVAVARTPLPGTNSPRVKGQRPEVG